MVDGKAKGARAETALRNLLVEKTGLNWQRVPASGALDARYGMKGDLYIPNEKNRYCVEAKAYKDSSITHNLLGAGSTNLDKWWAQALRQSAEVSQIPLLVFKHDRSKWFCAIQLEQPPECEYLYYSKQNVYILLFETLLKTEEMKWIK